MTSIQALGPGTLKKRPVIQYECAHCGKDIADQAIPMVVRLAAFVVPKAERDRRLGERQADGTMGFDTTDIGLPPVIRDLIDADKHPDGHAYIGLGCFIKLFGGGFPLINANGEEAPMVPREALNEKGVANTSFTGREHRDLVVVVEPKLFNEAGVRINPDGSPWIAPTT